MKLQEIKKRLESKSIFLTEDEVCRKPTVIGYDKQFRWRWFATQMNTFVIASDYGDETITEKSIENFLTESFEYSKKNYTGWPRGFQSGLSVIAFLISERVDEDAARYCIELRSGASGLASQFQ